MRVITERDGGRRGGTLEHEKTGNTPGAAVTKRLRLLEERGLVERRTDERDRRVSHFSLAEQGRELDRLFPEQVACRASLPPGLSTQRQHELAGHPQ